MHWTNFLSFFGSEWSITCNKILHRCCWFHLNCVIPLLVVFFKLYRIYTSHHYKENIILDLYSIFPISLLVRLTYKLVLHLINVTCWLMVLLIRLLLTCSRSNTSILSLKCTLMLFLHPNPLDDSFRIPRITSLKFSLKIWNRSMAMLATQW